MTAKVKINLTEGLIDLEGSEEFVSKYLDQFKDLISSPNLKGNTQPNASDKVHSPEKEEQVKRPSNGTGKKAAKPKGGKPKSIDIEKFDYLKDGSIISLEDFINEKKPGSTAGNIIAVIGYYIQHVKNMSSFTEGNIDFAYKILNIKGRPKHLRQIIINNKNQRDLFEEVPDKEGTWKLTRAGEIFVDEELPPKS